jgi:putative acetyltransferase
MTFDGIAVRAEMACDLAAFRALLLAAFGGPAEADLVEDLRRSDQIVLALCAIRSPDRLVGHVAFSRLAIDTPEGRRAAIGLAPLAVAEGFRRRGTGAALVCEGLDRLKMRGETIAFVLGDPPYYARFGFKVADAFASVYSGSHLQVRRLSVNAPADGTVRYPAAFDRL